MCLITVYARISFTPSLVLYYLIKYSIGEVVNLPKKFLTKLLKTCCCCCCLFKQVGESGATQLHNKTKQLLCLHIIFSFLITFLPTHIPSSFRACFTSYLLSFQIRLCVLMCPCAYSQQQFFL